MMTKKRGGESDAHLALKRAALRWAQRHRYSVCAPEVRLPHSRFRADLVAYKPASERVDVRDEKLQTTRRIRQPRVGTTVVFECKQARSDFLTDSRPIKETLDQLCVLQDRRAVLERNLGIHYPSLRNGDSLFQEYESRDLSNHDHKAYRKVVAGIAKLSNRLYGKTKFEKMIRYRCANLFYVVTCPGILETHEIPDGWGLLVTEDSENFESLQLVRKPVFHESDESTRLEFLHLAARAATRFSNREFDIEPVMDRAPCP